MNTHTHTALRALAEACGAETGMHAEKLVWIKFHKPALEKLAACIAAPAAALFDAGREAALITREKNTQVKDSPDGLDVLIAIEHALNSGHTTAEVLDENSPIRDALRARIRAASAAQPAAQDWAAVKTIPLSCPRCGEVLHVAQPAAQEPSMRHILLIQIHNLIDLAERYAAQMQAIDPDEQRYAEGAAAYARKVIEPYNYNGPDRAQPAAQEPIGRYQSQQARVRSAIEGVRCELEGLEKALDAAAIAIAIRAAQPAAQEPTLTPAQKLDALKFGANVATNLLQIGRSIGFGRAQQILGEQWEAEHDCAPRGRMGVTVKDAAQPAAQEPAITDEQAIQHILRAPPESFAGKWFKQLAAAQPAAQEPVAWLRNLTEPQPHAVTALKYRSASDVAAGVKYIPVYTQAQPAAQEPKE